MYHGLPVHLDDAIGFICGAIRSLDGESGTIAQITRRVAGSEDADRSVNGGPTPLYARVRMLLREALKVGRVERAGQRWTIARKKRR